MEETLLSNEDVMWITVTDDMIMRAGYHACTSNATSNRSNFFRHVKTHYTNNKNYKITKSQNKRLPEKRERVGTISKLSK